jgi:hypothetical protein
MILKTAYWTTSAFSALAREPAFIDATGTHEFNECARVIIRLSDPDGSMIQKYKPNPSGSVIYIGSGRAKLYDLSETCIFDGRILSSERTDKITTLVCEDWMNQLKDERIHYDFREDLDTAGLRESELKTNPSSGLYVGPAYTTGTDYYLFDNDMAWTNNQWNGYKAVLLGSNIGPVTIHTGPYDHSGGANMTANGWRNVWVDDSNKDYADSVGIGDLTWTFPCRVVDEDGPLFVTLDSVKINGTLAGNNTSGGIVLVGIDHDADATIYLIGQVNTESLADVRKFSFDIPGQYLSGLLTSDGVLPIVLYGYDDGANDAEIEVYFLEVEAHITASGYSSAIGITDTTAPNQLTVDTDCANSGLGLWEGHKYSITRALYNRINGIVTAGDPLVTLTTSIESTTGITTYHANDKTRFEILKYISGVDASVFWVPLGTTQVNWKQTTDSTATVLKDKDVLHWAKGKYDYTNMYNQAIIYGARIGDAEVTETVNDTTTQGQYDFIKSTIIRDAGILSNHEADAVADAFIARDKTIHLYLEAELKGWSSIRLGDYIQVTSDILGLTSANYTVSRWEYSGNTTKIRLHPRTTAGYTRYKDFVEEMKQQRSDLLETRLDKYLAPPKTGTWT